MIKAIVFGFTIVVSAFLIFYKGEYGYGLLTLAFLFFGAFADQIEEFSFGLTDGLRIQNIEKRINQINEKFEQEIFYGADFDSCNKITLKYTPIKNSLFVYWSPIVMVENLSYEVKGKVIDVSKSIEPGESINKKFDESTPLVVKYLIEI